MPYTCHTHAMPTFITEAANSIQLWSVIITSMGKLVAHGYSIILVIVDRLSMMYFVIKATSITKNDSVCMHKTTI